jgi:hypothetical protein
MNTFEEIFFFEEVKFVATMTNALGVLKCLKLEITSPVASPSIERLGSLLAREMGYTDGVTVRLPKYSARVRSVNSLDLGEYDTTDCVYYFIGEEELEDLHAKGKCTHKSLSRLNEASYDFSVLDLLNYCAERGWFRKATVLFDYDELAEDEIIIV